jgi:predicted transcriptional regulator
MIEKAWQSQARRAPQSIRMLWRRERASLSNFKSHLVATSSKKRILPRPSLIILAGLIRFGTERYARYGRYGQYGRPKSGFAAVYVMQGRKTSEEKIQRARQLRAQGCSIREIGRMLCISKSAIHDYCQDIRVPTDSPDEREGVQTEEESSATSVSDTVETPKPYAEMLLETQDVILDFCRVSAELGDKEGMEMARREFDRTMREGREYFRRQMLRARLGLPVEE